MSGLAYSPSGAVVRHGAPVVLGLVLGYLIEANYRRSLLLTGGDHIVFLQDPVSLGLLRKNKAAFCIYELAGHRSPEVVTADFVYVRLYGPGRKYQGNYSKADLNSWKIRCTKWTKDGLDVYIYFDNDEMGYAANNALL